MLLFPVVLLEAPEMVVPGNVSLAKTDPVAANRKTPTKTHNLANTPNILQTQKPRLTISRYPDMVKELLQLALWLKSPVRILILTFHGG